MARRRAGYALFCVYAVRRESAILSNG
jgi:hypothetical protein